MCFKSKILLFNYAIQMQLLQMLSKIHTITSSILIIEMNRPLDKVIGFV